MLKHEYICLNRDVCFLKEGKPILLPTGTELCSVYNDTGKKEENCRICKARSLNWLMAGISLRSGARSPRGNKVRQVLPYSF